MMNPNDKIKRHHVKQAFVSFDKKGPPPHHGKSITKLVINPDNGEGYPPKAIYYYARKKIDSLFTYKKYKGYYEVKNKLESLGYKIVPIANTLEARVEKSLKDGPKKRLARLEKAAKKPVLYPKKIKFFDRNPDVIAEVLFRAKGKCGCCGKPAPFKRKKDCEPYLKPYLEVHHKIQLAAGGDDTVENAVALCPNCHRKQHYGDSRTKPRLLVISY